MPDPKTYILDDLPTDKDALDFKPYVETLVDVCKTASTPLTIGVFGTWGSGKTSLMKMVRKGLQKENFTVAWFAAWKYDKEESLWRAFLLCILTALKDTAKSKGEPIEEFEKLETLLYREMEIEKVGGVTIDLAKLGGKVAQGLAQLSLSFIPGISTLTKLVEELQSGAASSATEEAMGAIQRERTKIYIEHVRFLEQFHGKFSGLVEQHVLPNRLVVFVDDLDRCLPEKAIEVLEAIKLFVDATGCVFVLGLDQEVIARGIEMKYKELGEKKDGEGKGHFTIEGMRYLEKIIQLPFQIPPVEQTDMGDFVHGLTADWPHEECPRVFAVGLGDNPRQIKRTVNVFLMLWNLAEKRKAKLEGRIKPIRLAKIVAIQAIYPELYDLLKETPRYLRELEEYYRRDSVPIESLPTNVLERIADGEYTDEDDFRKENLYETQQEPPPALANFISRISIRRILTLHPSDLSDANFSGLKPDELRLYFTLTRSAEAPQPASFEMQSSFFEPQVVFISKGTFLMGSAKEQAEEAIRRLPMNSDMGVNTGLIEEQPQHLVELDEYFIGKYPITNHEYQFFVKDTKYRSPANWNDDQYPQDKGDCPVVNVSWEDAIAYCKWLSQKTGKGYRLPTEAEWEKAARGNKDARTYPWGYIFESNRANTREWGIEQVTPVGQFSPQGDSPYGCADMSGNVCEWCSDWFSENEYEIRARDNLDYEVRARYFLSDDLSPDNDENTSPSIANPKGPGSGAYRILRGGSFNDISPKCRCSSRHKFIPIYWDEYYGFRVAYSMPQTNAKENRI